jgi:hypothetical protein
MRPTDPGDSADPATDTATRKPCHPVDRDGELMKRTRVVAAVVAATDSALALVPHADTL